MHVTLPDGVRLATLTAGMALANGAARTETFRRRDADMTATAYAIPLAGVRTFSAHAPARRRGDHAQPRAIARRPADCRQHQG